MVGTTTFRSKKLLDSAKGQQCVTCGSTGTTVAAHANSVALGKGVGIKAPDYFTVHFCLECHALYDGRIGKLTHGEKEYMWLLAYVRTVQRWFEQEIVVVK